MAGDTSAGGLNRIKWILSEKNIKIVVLCLGANDMLRGIKPDETMKKFRENYKYHSKQKDFNYFSWYGSTIKL